MKSEPVDPAMMPEEQPDQMQETSASGTDMVQQATPEEQSLYEKFVAKAWMLVYDPKMFPKIIEMLEGGGDPMEGLARATATIVARIASMAEQAGQKLSGDVILHAGKEVFEDLAELSGRAGIKDFAADEDAMEGAFFRAMDHFRTMLQGAGRINQQAAQADMGKLEEMDKSGQLEQMLRGLADRDEKSRPKKPAPKEDEQPPSRGLMRETA